MRQVRDDEQDVPLGFLRLTAYRFERGDGVADGPHFGNLVLGLPARLLEPADLFGNIVPFTPEVVCFLLYLAPLLIQRKELAEIDFAPAPADRRFYFICPFPNEL